MIKIISYISFVFAGLFLLLLIGMLFQNVKKKSLKNTVFSRLFNTSANYLKLFCVINYT